MTLTFVQNRREHCTANVQIGVLIGHLNEARSSISAANEDLGHLKESASGHDTTAADLHSGIDCLHAAVSFPENRVRTVRTDASLFYGSRFNLVCPVASFERSILSVYLVIR